MRSIRQTYLQLFFLFIFSFPAFAKGIDVHFHIFSPKNFPHSNFGPFKPIRAAGVIALLDDASIDQAVILSAGYMFRDHAKAAIENDFTAAQIHEAKDRLIGFCGIHLQNG